MFEASKRAPAATEASLAAEQKARQKAEGKYLPEEGRGRAGHTAATLKGVQAELADALRSGEAAQLELGTAHGQ